MGIPDPDPDPNPDPDPDPDPNPDPDPDPDLNPDPDPDPGPNPSPSPGPGPSPDPTTSPDPNPSPDPDPGPDPTQVLPIMHITETYAKWSGNINRQIFQHYSDGAAVAVEAVSNVRTAAGKGPPHTLVHHVYITHQSTTH